jgi:ABC-type polysaccharide/polyol phosphate transport system ATPase subunit
MQVIAKNISVDFPLLGQKRNIRNKIISGVTGGRLFKNHKNVLTVRALNNISFHAKSGDRIGFLGHNGAGKSTMLRVLSGVYFPTSGSIYVEGKITPLLQTAPGLEMEDTGYDNIINCGLNLGMSLEEILGKIDDIIDFSGLGDYINIAVRNYSSGMLSRLSFSIATAVKPGILILDEGIGTADAKFADTAAKKIDELTSSTEILFLASHSESLIKSMCNKAVVLEKGSSLYFGDIDTALEVYKNS